MRLHAKTLMTGVKIGRTAESVPATRDTCARTAELAVTGVRSSHVHCLLFHGDEKDCLPIPWETYEVGSNYLAFYTMVCGTLALVAYVCQGARSAALRYLYDFWL